MRGRGRGQHAGAYDLSRAINKSQTASGWSACCAPIRTQIVVCNAGTRGHGAYEHKISARARSICCNGCSWKLRSLSKIQGSRKRGVGGRKVQVGGGSNSMIAMRAQHLKTQREISENCSGKGRGKGRIREEGREEDWGGVEAQKLHAARHDNVWQYWFKCHKHLRVAHRETRRHKWQIREILSMLHRYKVRKAEAAKAKQPGKQAGRHQVVFLVWVWVCAQHTNVCNMPHT